MSKELNASVCTVDLIFVIYLSGKTQGIGHRRFFHFNLQILSHNLGGAQGKPFSKFDSTHL